MRAGNNLWIKKPKCYDPFQITLVSAEQHWGELMAAIYNSAIAGAAVFAVLASPAFAQVCTSSCPPSGHLVSSSFAPPAVYTSNAVLSSNAEISVPNIGSAVAAAFSGPGFGQLALYNLGPEHTGAAAGDAAMPVQGWLSTSGGRTGDQHPNVTSGFGSVAGAGGLQRMMTPAFLLGVSLTGDGSMGTVAGGLRSNSSSYGVAPYMGYAFNPKWNGFVAGGYNTVSSTLASSVAGGGAGNFGSDRWYINGGVNAAYTVGSFNLAPLASLLYQEQRNDAYKDTGGAAIAGTTSTLGRASLGATLTLPMVGWSPFLKGALEVDFDRSNTVNPVTGANVNYSPVGGVLGAGVNLPVASNMTATVDASYDTLGRTNLTGWSARARLNIRF
jgi:hypothetical protein